MRPGLSGWEGRGRKWLEREEETGRSTLTHSMPSSCQRSAHPSPPPRPHTHPPSPHLPPLTCGAGRRGCHAHVDSRAEVGASHANRCSGFAQPEGGGQGGSILYRGGGGGGGHTDRCSGFAQPEGGGQGGSVRYGERGAQGGREGPAGAGAPAESKEGKECPSPHKHKCPYINARTATKNAKPWVSLQNPAPLTVGHLYRSSTSESTLTPAPLTSGQLYFGSTPELTHTPAPLTSGR